VVLLLHGVRADRLAMVSRAQLLTRQGFSVLLIDLQAHGATPGEAITLGYRESTDVVAHGIGSGVGRLVVGLA
jgi:uncharacterized protein